MLTQATLGAWSAVEYAWTLPPQQLQATLLQTQYITYRGRRRSCLHSCSRRDGHNPLPLSPGKLLVILKLKNLFGDQLLNTFLIISYYSGPLVLLGKNPLRESDQMHTDIPGALIHFPSAE